MSGGKEMTLFGFIYKKKVFGNPQFKASILATSAAAFPVQIPGEFFH